MIAVPADMLVSAVLKGAARSGIKVEGLADRSLEVAGCWLQVLLADGTWSSMCKVLVEQPLETIRIPLTCGIG